MGKSSSTPTPEDTRASTSTSAIHISVQKPAQEREVDTASTLGERVVSGVGGNSPQTLPTHFATLLGNLRGSPSTQAAILRQLQRRYGNTYVGEVIQAKLEINQPGDAYEQEADRVAAQVMRMPEEEAGVCLAQGAASEKLTSPLVPDEPVKVTFDEDRPWLFKVEGDPSYAAIANEIYGRELSEFVGKAEETLYGQNIPLLNRYVALPELLVPHYRSKFHSNMRKVLTEDVRKVENILFEWRIDADDEATLTNYVSWWAGRRDLRTESGESYFDAFLTRLKEDQWYRDYFLFEGSRQSYLDLLYNEVEERAGELNSIIAQNSEKFGAYEPYVLVHGQGEDIKTEGLHFSINEDFVTRTADLILARLEGFTSEDDSKIIKDALTGLPAPYQAAVLKEIMSRHGETEFFGLLGRYGEPTETGMLFYLFEDLEDKDKESVAESLKSSGVLPPDAIDKLIEGRGLIGEYLPWSSHQIGKFIEWSTGKYEERQEYWAKKYEESSGLEAAWAFFWGSVVSLWTKETWDETALILTLGRLGPKLVAALPVTLQRGLLVAGTGAAAYQTTIAIQELATGKDAYTGEDLDRADLIARALNAFSNILFVAAGFTAANQLAASVPKTLGGKPLFQFRILRADTKSGEYAAIAQDLAHGEYAIISLNARTGNGIATNTTTGRSVPIVNGQLQGDPAGLLPAIGMAQEGAMVSTTRALAPAAAEGSALTGGTLSSQLPQAVTGTTLLPAATGLAGTEALMSVPEAEIVWANPASRIYHPQDSPHYQNTKRGSLMTAEQAEALGYRRALPVRGGQRGYMESTLPSTAGRVVEEHWSHLLGSPQNPGQAQGGRFRTPYANVEPDFVPAVDASGTQVFGREWTYARLHGVPSVSDALAVADSKYLGFFVDVKTISFGLFGDRQNQIKGMIWLAQFTQSRTFVILGKPNQNVGDDIIEFAQAYDVQITIQTHPLIK